MKCRKCGCEIPTRLLKQDAFSCPSCGNQYRRRQLPANAQKRVRVRTKKQPALSFLRRKLWKLPVWGWLIILLLGIIGMGMNAEEQPDTEQVPQIVQPTVQPVQENILNEDSGLAVSLQSHLYDRAEVRDVLNGYRTEKIGEYSIIRADSSEITIESLSDWYYNYVVQNDFKWCMILYTDKNDNSGVYAFTSMVEEGIIFEQDEYGDYSIGSEDFCTIYVPSDNGILKEWASEPEQKEWEQRFQETQSTVKSYISTSLSSYNVQNISLTYWLNEPDVYSAMFNVTIGEQSVGAIKAAIQEIENLTADYRIDYAVSFYNANGNMIADVSWGAAHDEITVFANGTRYVYQSLEEFPTG